MMAKTPMMLASAMRLLVGRLASPTRTLAPRSCALQHHVRLLSCTTRTHKLAGLWQNWINNVWNRLDEGRLRLVGPERLVTEWTLRMGGRALLQGQHDSGYWVADYNTLPWLQDTNQGIKPRGSVKLLEVDFNNIEGIKDTGMQHFGLKGLNNLTFVGLRNCDEVTDIGIKYLENLPALTRVDLAGTAVTGAGVASLLRNRDDAFTVAVHAMPDLPSDPRIQNEVESVD
ncbi:hypothetical protein PTSG_05653 [Salpingoeca rosetta]|uniref:Uncharacterized protein n=1 Tax=Salpingoeca rosetta (strain ATCC 50818 / BSB-021) TaxID=946362 RepID=F2UBU3_SALR5|nr:uncharacterized protein PTSG_05653 [Salpingoeca rosetta]EGD73959.1 hypothetical protein PTSG_05653 [Salpingoeca rosetta]|eukprot:XP_004993522.1 hypothetical protein PTSG_05653 [Salpingoeca rosetta]